MFLYLYMFRTVNNAVIVSFTMCDFQPYFVVVCKNYTNSLVLRSTVMESIM